MKKRPEERALDVFGRGTWLVVCVWLVGWLIWFFLSSTALVALALALEATAMEKVMVMVMVKEWGLAGAW